MPSVTRAGFVALIGEPNAGKSTLLNRMVGAKVSIVTHKAQTTRSQVRGVLAVECGYANGHVPQPRYEQVCTGRTGHAEVVRVQFDAQTITLRELLLIFFAIHDPTTPNRQGHDVGPQYRSVIYTTAPAQAQAAQAVMAELQPHWAAPIVTELQALACYWPAEAEHQRYFSRHPEQGYCTFVVRPKVEKLHQAFAEYVRVGDGSGF